MNETILQYLRDYPAFRERSTKNKWLGGIIFKKYGIEITPKMKDQMQDIISDLQSADRAWRKILEEHEELRGSDYGEKTILEQKKQLELGYEPNYYQDIKK